ncbi:MAG: oligopeptide/dipeptide ABC transporter ATP-binding protein [Spirochaetota bacterium]
MPRLDRPEMNRLYSIPGQPPGLIDMPAECPFHPRCGQVLSVCREKYPLPVDLGNNRQVCCWLYQ